MPSNDLPGLAEQLAYYKAGGGKKDPIDTFNKVFGTVTNAGDAYNHIIKEVLANKHAALTNQMSQQELETGQRMAQPVDSYFGKRPGTATAGVQDVSAPAGTDEVVTSAPQVSNTPNELAQYGPVPVDIAGKLSAIEASQRKGIEQPISVKLLPIEAKKRAIAAGYTEDDMLPPKLFNAIKGFDASSAVPYTGAAAAVQQGSGPANAKIIGEPQQGVGGYADVKLKGNLFSSLPSQTSPTNVSGAAAQVQLAVRQGKGLIAKPGSPQQIALASSDVARAVQRSAPQLETLNGSSFANNFVTQISALSQKITADPTSADVPKLRKQIYDILNELENTSKPVVERSLNNIESIYAKDLPQNWQEIKNRELGADFPDIPFQENQSANPQDQEALIWANANPTDPRAIQIKQRLGVK